MKLIGALILALGALFIAFDSEAGALRERLAERAEQRRATSGTPATLPAGTKVQRNVAYGDHADQRMDIYSPADAREAPMLFLVHGGGWRRGDKAHGRLIDNKLAHWLPAGIVIVSINYRTLPEADVLKQRDDLVTALAAVQTRAHEWGGDASRVVLMAHSAGAHLVALVAAAPLDARVRQPWLGSVLLDSGALDVERLMAERHHSLFDDAFGKDPAFWIATSPVRQLAAPGAPWLAVCSSQRRQACDQVKAFAQRVRETGGRIDELPLAKSHAAINEELGLPGAYTARVDDFLREVGLLAR